MLPQLRAELDLLIARRTKFETETRRLSERQIRFRPAEGSWSIAQVAHHLLHVEREVGKAAAKPGVTRVRRMRNPREWIGFGIFLSIVRLDVRIKIPQKVAGRVTPEINPDIEQIWSDWSEVHTGFARYLETIETRNLREMAFRHPIMGPTQVRGMLSFLRQHFDHHMRQVVRIRRASGYPAT